MRKVPFLGLALFFSLLSFLVSCSSPPAPTPENTQPPPTPTNQALSPTPKVTAPSSTPTPTPHNGTLNATPTVLAEWTTPGAVLNESDYMYYDRLLLTKDETTSNGLITGASGLSISNCETCDIMVSRYVYADHLPSDTGITFVLLIKRHLTEEAAISALENKAASTLDKGADLVPVSANLELPDDLRAFAASGTVFVIAHYGSFEIYLAQDVDAGLGADMTANLFCELLQLQISKLRTAGY